jgi:osmoprotectant transport system ATP-binding protein
MPQPRSAKDAPEGIPTVPVGASLKDAFAALLANESGWVAVREGDQLLGVLTAGSLHAALLRATPEAVSQ